MRSSNASKKAVEWGYKNVYYFRLGFPAWKAAGYPAE
jgi:rhodanese-related sulfurtransferase